MKTAKDLKIPFSWEERRPVLLDKFFYVPAKFDYQREEVSFFRNNQPIAVEYCSGNGQWIGDKARENPHLNWIAVEKKFNRARKIWLKIHREKIENLCVVCSEALIFTKFYAPKFLKAYINFPDPWPKLRHAKHRLVRLSFIEELALLVEEQVVCATDDKNYFLEMKTEFAKSAQWALADETQNLPHYGSSFFKDLWVERGRIIYYLTYEKT